MKATGIFVLVVALVSAALADPPCPKGKSPIDDENIRAARTYQLVVLARGNPEEQARLSEAMGLSWDDILKCVQRGKGHRSAAEIDADREQKKNKP